MNSQKQKKLRFLNRGDWIVYLVIVIIAITSAYFIPGMQTAQASESVRIQCGDRFDVYPIAQNRVLTLNERGYHLTVVIENKTVSVKDSDCRDRLCVAVGAISKPGEAIVCLPAHILITVEGGNADADIILG